MWNFALDLLILVGTLIGLFLLFAAPGKTVFWCCTLGVGFAGSTMGIGGTIIGLLVGACVGGVLIGIGLGIRAVYVGLFGDAAHRRAVADARRLAARAERESRNASDMKRTEGLAVRDRALLELEDLRAKQWARRGERFRRLLR